MFLGVVRRLLDGLGMPGERRKGRKLGCSLLH